MLSIIELDVRNKLEAFQAKLQESGFPFKLLPAIDKKLKFYSDALTHAQIMQLLKFLEVPIQLGVFAFTIKAMTEKTPITYHFIVTHFNEILLDQYLENSLNSTPANLSVGISSSITAAKRSSNGTATSTSNNNSSLQSEFNAAILRLQQTTNSKENAETSSFTSFRRGLVDAHYRLNRHEWMDISELEKLFAKCSEECVQTSTTTDNVVDQEFASLCILYQRLVEKHSQLRQLIHDPVDELLKQFTYLELDSSQETALLSPALQRFLHLFNLQLRDLEQPTIAKIYELFEVGILNVKDIQTKGVIADVNHPTPAKITIYGVYVEQVKFGSENPRNEPFTLTPEKANQWFELAKDMYGFLAGTSQFTRSTDFNETRELLLKQAQSTPGNLYGYRASTTIPFGAVVYFLLRNDNNEPTVHQLRFHFRKVGKQQYNLYSATSTAVEDKHLENNFDLANHLLLFATGIGSIDELALESILIHSKIKIPPGYIASVNKGASKPETHKAGTKRKQERFLEYEGPRMFVMPTLARIEQTPRPNSSVSGLEITSRK